MFEYISGVSGEIPIDESKEIGIELSRDTAGLVVGIVLEGIDPLRIKEDIDSGLRLSDIDLSRICILITKPLYYLDKGIDDLIIYTKNEEYRHGIIQLIGLLNDIKLFLPPYANVLLIRLANNIKNELSGKENIELADVYEMLQEFYNELVSN